MAAEFKTWFPASVNPRFKGINPPDPKMRVICFPNAGNSEDVFTNTARIPSALSDWCEANNAQLLSVQYPGRYARKKEPFITTPQEMAAGLVAVLAPALDKPYVLLAHSVGTWVAFETLQLIRSKGLALPQQVIVSGFPSPDLPIEERPWKVGNELSEEEFKDEARGWDVTEDVFRDDLWLENGWNFHAILRNDFTLFDSYEFDPVKAEPLNVPIQAYYATRDRKVTQAMVQGWSRFTTQGFKLEPVEGNHLFLLNKEDKVAWLKRVADIVAVVQSKPATPCTDSDEDDLAMFGATDLAPAPAQAPAPAPAPAPSPAPAPAPAASVDSDEEDLAMFL